MLNKIFLNDVRGAQWPRWVLAIAGLTLIASFANGGGEDGEDEGSGDHGVSDETIGSLPGVHGGGTTLGGAGLFDARPTFSLWGPAADVYGAITWVSLVPGEGFVSESLLAPGHVRLDFHGDIGVELYEQALGSVEMGVRAGIAPMKAALAAQGHVAPVRTIGATQILGLPFERMQTAGLLDEPATLHTYDSLSGRHRTRIESFGGLLTVTQDL